MLQRALLNNVIAGLVRRSWLVTIATVIACAGFAATAVAALIEARYLEPRGAIPLASGPRAAPPSPPRRDPGVLVARNVFCSTCAPVDGADPADNFSPRGTLIATEIGGPSPRATIIVAPDVFGTWQVGDDVPRLGKIAAIDRAAITVVDGNGRRGRLVLDKDRAATRSESPASPWDDRVRAIDAHTYEIDRTLVRELVGNGGAKAGTRVVPVADHGGAGLRLAGVQPGSIAAALGLASGDVVRSIDGEPITYDRLLDLYSKIDRVGVVRLTGTRGDQPLALELRLL